MYKVSEIIKNKKEVKIVFENKKSITMSYKIFLNHRLCEGDIVDIKEYMNAISLSMIKEAMRLAVFYLSKSDKSKKQIYDILSKKYYHKSIKDSAIDKLISEGLINDKRFAVSYINSRLSLGYGKQRIVSELYTKGINNSMIDEAFSDSDYEEEYKDKLLSLVKKASKSYDMNDYNDVQKLKAKMLRKGYKLNDISEAISKI